MSNFKKYSEQIDTFVSVCHHLAAKMYVTGHGGNAAWRLEDDLILITPTKTNKGDVTRENVVFIDMKGEKVEGDAKPTGEVPMYLNFFRERPDIQSVVHCHPTVTNAFAITTQKNWLERPLFPETITEVGPVPIVPYEEPLTQKLADVFLPYLERYNAFIMENHGLVIMSPWDVKWIQMCTDLLEMTSVHIVNALSMGGSIKELSHEHVANLHNVNVTRGLPLFGKPGYYERLEECFFPELRDERLAKQQTASA